MTLRRTMRERRNRLPPSERAERNRRLLHNLKTVLDRFPGHALCLYYPTDGEPDLLPLLHTFPHSDVFFPTVEDRSLRFVRADASSRFAPGAFGIPEPVDRSVPLPQKDTVVCLPGTAFDTRGGRLGRGQGFYDRFLASRKAVKIGIAWDFQLLESPLPLSPADVPMDIIVTDSRILETGGPP